MTYIVSFCIEYNRYYPAIMLDARGSIPALANQIGVVQKEYTDAQVALVTDNANVIPFIIQTNEGNLVGYFTLLVDKVAITCVLYQFVLRPAFEQFVDEIQIEIDTFIQGNLWTGDYLPNP